MNKILIKKLMEVLDEIDNYETTDDLLFEKRREAFKANWRLLRALL